MIWVFSSFMSIDTPFSHPIKYLMPLMVIISGEKVGICGLILSKPWTIGVYEKKYSKDLNLSTTEAFKYKTLDLGVLKTLPLI